MRLISLPHFLLLAGLVSVSFTSPVQAQEKQDTSKPTSVDPRLLEWEKARIVKEYTIAEVKITGIRYLDTSIVYSIANLQPGDKFVHPGAELFGKVLRRLLMTFSHRTEKLVLMQEGRSKG